MQRSLWVSLKSISWHSCPQYWAIWQKEQVFNFLFFFFNCSESSLQVKQNRFSTKLISSMPRINLDRISDYFTIKPKSRKNLKASKTRLDGRPRFGKQVKNNSTGTLLRTFSEKLRISWAEAETIVLITACFHKKIKTNSEIYMNVLSNLNK